MSNNTPIKRDGTRLLCVLPKTLGKVTRLVVRKNKVFAETESGIQFIVPTGKKTA